MERDEIKPYFADENKDYNIGSKQGEPAKDIVLSGLEIDPNHATVKSSSGYHLSSKPLSVLP